MAKTEEIPLSSIIKDLDKRLTKQQEEINELHCSVASLTKTVIKLSNRILTLKGPEYQDG